jgi:hypothetical protein
MSDSGPRLGAIYDLQQDSLRLVYPSIGGNTTPYPTDFEPADIRMTYVFHRDLSGAQAANVAAKKPANPEDEEALAGLRKELTTAIGLLEAKKYREFLEGYMAPKDRETAQQGGQWDSMVERLQQTGPGLIKIFRVLLTETPTFDSSKTGATFDTREIHIEGMPGLPEKMKFLKSGEKWYIQDR